MTDTKKPKHDQIQVNEGTNLYSELNHLVDRVTELENRITSGQTKSVQGELVEPLKRDSELIQENQELKLHNIRKMLNTSEELPSSKISDDPPSIQKNETFRSVCDDLTKCVIDQIKLGIKFLLKQGGANPVVNELLINSCKDLEDFERLYEIIMKMTLIKQFRHGAGLGIMAPLLLTLLRTDSAEQGSFDPLLLTLLRTDSAEQGSFDPLLLTLLSKGDVGSGSFNPFLLTFFQKNDAKLGSIDPLLLLYLTNLNTMQKTTTTSSD